jgi:hypothetical protein
MVNKLDKEECPELEMVPEVDPGNELMVVACG